MTTNKWSIINLLLNTLLPGVTYYKSAYGIAIKPLVGSIQADVFGHTSA